MFNVRELRLHEAEYAVFDDMLGGLERLEFYKGWLGAQAEFTVTDKYARKQKVTWGRPTIMLMNESPFSYGCDHDWLMRNCDVVHVTDPFISISHANTQPPGC